MRGLLRKDFYSLIKTFYMILIVYGVFLVLSIVTGDLSLLFFGSALTGLLPVNLVSGDERDGWQHYCMALPVSRKTYVDEKYLFGLICTALGLIGAVLAAFAAGSGAGDIVAALPVMLALGIAPPALSMPFVLRLGTAKGQIPYLIVCGAAWGCACAMLRDGAAPVIPGLPAGILALAAAIVYAVSRLISVRLFMAREL